MNRTSVCLIINIPTFLLYSISNRHGCVHYWMSGDECRINRKMAPSDFLLMLQKQDGGTALFLPPCPHALM